MSWGLVATAAATVGSSLIGSRSADKAAEAQERQGERAIDFQREAFEAAENRLAPFIQGDTPAQQEQQALVGLLGPEAQQAAMMRLETPATQRLRSEGFRALDQRAAAQGQLGGSNRLKALQEFASNFDFNRASGRFNQLGALTQQPLAAASALTGTQTATAAGQAQTAQNIGQAQAQGRLARGQSFQSGLEGLGSIGMNIFG